ncbi:MAG: hypothetical protein ABIP75_12495 [Pyrinomonadaceae bacterium]
MAETKAKTNDSLRTPKPKKKLGLSVPPPLRMPHEDLIHMNTGETWENREAAAPTPVVTPVSPPAVTTAPTAAITTANTPTPTDVPAPAAPTAATAVELRAADKHITAVTTPVTEPLSPTNQGAERKPRTEVPFGKSNETYIDATHRASEQQIYSVMYRETISKGTAERFFGASELMRKTGIRSDKTVRTALRGLREKLSIEIVQFTYGNPLGPRYRIFGPKEILQRRREAGIEIDPQSKQIITPVTTEVMAGEKTWVSGTAESYRSAPVKETPVTPVNFTGHSKYIKENWSERGETPSSSSKSQAADGDDDAVSYLDSVRQLYEQITGNPWSPSDTETAIRGKAIPVEIWGIALCYCIDRAPGNTFQRLAYALDEARAHEETMNQFSAQELRAILKHNLRTLERVRKDGIWRRPAEGASE